VPSGDEGLPWHSRDDTWLDNMLGNDQMVALQLLGCFC